MKTGSETRSSETSNVAETVVEAEERLQQKDLNIALEDLNRSANTSIFTITLATMAHSYVASQQVDLNAIRITGVAGILVLGHSLLRFIFFDLFRQAQSKFRHKEGYILWKGLLGAILAAAIFTTLILGETLLLYHLWDSG